MNTIRTWMLAATIAGSAALAATAAQAQGKSLTLCWAAWDPANALVELSKDFTAKTNIAMKFEFVPWPNFADRMLNELNSKGKLCDLIIGDSQWIGGSAENKHYVKLNDFFAKEGIKIDDFMPATVAGYAEWPKNTPNYWALPAMGDALGWTYRKDWFAKPALQAEFKAKYNRDLAAPKTQTELKQIAEFFQGRDDRRQEGLWRGDLHRARLGRHHHGRRQRALSLRLQISGPEEALRHGRLRQLRRRGEGPGILQVALQVLHPAGLLQRLYAGGARRLQIRPGRDADELVRLLPGLFKDPNVGGDKIGFFVNPAEKEKGSQLGGQGLSVVSYSANQAEALAYIKWFASLDVQKKWWELGGYTCHKGVLNDPGFAKSAPFAADFLVAMGQVVDFWAEPSYAQLMQAMQARIHDYVVADKGTAKQALDLLIQDWTKVFKEDGKL
jgi:multiple sugar transport system substrate-binding protein